MKDTTKPVGEWSETFMEIIHNSKTLIGPSKHLAEKLLNDLYDFIKSLLSKSRLDTIQEIKERVESGTPRYIKGGELRTQYFAKGYNEFRKDVLSTLSEMEKKV